MNHNEIKNSLSNNEIEFNFMDDLEQYYDEEELDEKFNDEDEQKLIDKKINDESNIDVVSTRLYKSMNECVYDIIMKIILTKKYSVNYVKSILMTFQENTTFLNYKSFLQKYIYGLNQVSAAISINNISKSSYENENYPNNHINNSISNEIHRIKKTEEREKQHEINIKMMTELYIREIIDGCSMSSQIALILLIYKIDINIYITLYKRLYDIYAIFGVSKQEFIDLSESRLPKKLSNIYYKIKEHYMDDISNQSYIEIDKYKIYFTDKRLPVEIIIINAIISQL